MSRTLGYLDPSSPSDGNDISSGQIYENTSPRRTINAVKFLVRVLTRPIPMDADDVRIIMEEGWIEPDLQIGEDGDNISQRTEFSSDTARGSDGVVKIMFRGRIIRSNNGLKPHIFLRDPCRLMLTRDIGFIYRLLAKHTLFLSKTGFSGTTPKIGDIVEVTLQRGDFEGPELQTAYFDEIVDQSQSELYTYSAFNERCTSLVAALEGGGFSPGAWADGDDASIHANSRRATDEETQILNINGLAARQLFYPEDKEYFRVWPAARGATLRALRSRDWEWQSADLSYVRIEEFSYGGGLLNPTYSAIIDHVKSGHTNARHAFTSTFGSGTPAMGTYTPIFDIVVGRDSSLLSSPTTIVFHHSATAGRDSRATERGTLAKAGYSYHFTIYQDGSIDHAIPIDYRHIGSNNHNSDSIGISFENLGNQVDYAHLSHETDASKWDGANADGEFNGSSVLVGPNGTRGPWEPFTTEQLDSAFALVSFLKIIRPTLSTIITHSSYRERKQDTGPNLNAYQPDMSASTAAKPSPMAFFKKILTFIPIHS